jgi:hypothetical protein
MESKLLPGGWGKSKDRSLTTGRPNVREQDWARQGATGGMTGRAGTGVEQVLQAGSNEGILNWIEAG